MRLAQITAALVSLLACSSDGWGGDALKKLVAELDKRGVKTTITSGTPTFTVLGPASPEWDQSLAARLADHFRSDKSYVGANITHLRRAAAAKSYDVWAPAARRSATMARALQRRGVPAAAIVMGVEVRPDAPRRGALVITFHRKRNWLRRAGDNLVGGLTDVVASPDEVRKGVVTQTKRRGAVAGGATGAVGGFGAAVRRAGTGAVRILTFWAG